MKKSSSNLAFLCSVLFAFLFCPSLLFGQSIVSSAKANYYHFVGTIDSKLPIVMDLVQNGSTYLGSYYYRKYNRVIYLEGQRNSEGEIELSVTDKKGEETEFIVGKIHKNTFVGNWKNKDKSKILSISLVEDYSKSIDFTIVSIRDSIKLFKNEKETPKATFSGMVVEAKQVPYGGNLLKVKEILRKYQSFEDKKITQTPIQVIEDNKKSFFKDYLELNKNIEKERLYSANWVKQEDANVVFNDNYFATLSFLYYQYMGGAHGMFTTNYVVIDVKNGKKIKLNDIFDKTAITILEKKIIKKAYNYTGFENPTSLKDAGYLVNKIEVTDNFSLTAEGITFVYQPYEIAPYSAGMPSFLFTWEEIKDLVKTDSSVRSLIK